MRLESIPRSGAFARKLAAKVRHELDRSRPQERYRLEVARQAHRLSYSATLALLEEAWAGLDEGQRTFNEGDQNLARALHSPGALDRLRRGAMVRAFDRWRDDDGKMGRAPFEPALVEESFRLAVEHTPYSWAGVVVRQDVELEALAAT